MNSVNRGVGVWHIGYNGPRTVEFIESFPWPHGNMTTGENRNKSIVLFHGIPEVVDEKDLYDNGADCYMEAATRSSKKAIDEMTAAAGYAAEAAKGNKP